MVKSPEKESEEKMEPKSDGQLAIGAFFVILGLLLLLNNLFPYLNFWKLWPLLLVFAGVMMLTRGRH